jgi:hypothetical protein
MAVVQISRIQHRRGRAGIGTGFPQLASGEIGWAVDTQELYIGNGSVAEGSPAVGNTRILTQRDLSAQSNLLQQLQYIYKVNDTTISTGSTTGAPVGRYLQDRLDDVPVSGASFGVVSNNVADDTVALQRAINQLFLNANHKASLDTADGAKSRVYLNLAPGIIKTSGTIFIPSYASITGAGRNKTYIKYTPATITGKSTGSTTLNSPVLYTNYAAIGLIGNTITGPNIPANTVVVSANVGVSITLSQNASSTQSGGTFICTGPVFRFVNDTSSYTAPSTYLLASGTLSGTINTTSTNQPRHISLKDITLESVSSAGSGMVLDAVRESIFESVGFKGSWGSTITESSRAIEFNSFQTYLTERNIFRNIHIEGFTYAGWARRDISNNTIVDGTVYDCGYGFILGRDALGGSTAGESVGPVENIISGIKFTNVKRQAVYVGVALDSFATLGQRNTVINCKLINVGNDGAGPASPIYPQIYFNAHGNSAINNVSDRTLALADMTSMVNKPYIPEVAGHGTYSVNNTRAVTLSQSTNATAFRLPMPTLASGTPANSISYQVDYTYRSDNNFTRSGRMLISAHVGASGSLPIVQLSDDYNFAGTDNAIGSSTKSLALQFSAVLINYAGTAYTGAVGTAPYSIGIYYSNTLTGDSGTLYYTYTATA